MARTNIPPGRDNCAITCGVNRSSLGKGRKEKRERTQRRGLYHGQRSRKRIQVGSSEKGEVGSGPDLTGPTSDSFLRGRGKP